MKIIDLQTHVELAGQLCREIFTRFEIIHPMVHAVSRDGQHHLLMVPQIGGTDDEKDIVAVGMRESFKKLDIVQYVLMCESWTLWIKETSPSSDMKKLPRPSAHPDRIEVITLQGETKDQTICGEIRINRDKDGKGTLGKLSTFRSEISHGRLTGLLQTEQ